MTGWVSTYGTKIPRAVAASNARRGRRYVDAATTSYGMQVTSPACEHCDGSESQLVREDELRGWVCPICDDALDEMFEEPAPGAEAIPAPPPGLEIEPLSERERQRIASWNRPERPGVGADTVTVVECANSPVDVR